MAATLRTNVKIDDPMAMEYAQATFVESVELLGAASQGVIVPMNESRLDKPLSAGGDFFTVPNLARQQNLVRRKDHTADPATPLTLRNLSYLDNKGVVLHRIGEPIGIARLASQIGISDEATLSRQVGEQYGFEMFRKLKLDAYNVLRGALPAVELDVVGGSTSTDRHVHRLYVEDAGAPVTPTFARLQAAKHLMGDRASGLVTAIMHSDVEQALWLDGITNYKLDTIAGTNIRFGRVEALGLNIIVDDDGTIDDSPMGDLSTLAPDRYWTFILGPGAMTWAYQAAVEIESDRKIDGEDKLWFARADGSWGVHLNNMKWNSATVNPTDTELATSSNWDEAYSHHKEVNAVALVTN